MKSKMNSSRVASKTQSRYLRGVDNNAETKCGVDSNAEARYHMIEDVILHQCGYWQRE